MIDTRWWCAGGGRPAARVVRHEGVALAHQRQGRSQHPTTSLQHQHLHRQAGTSKTSYSWFDGDEDGVESLLSAVRFISGDVRSSLQVRTEAARRRSARQQVRARCDAQDARVAARAQGHAQHRFQTLTSTRQHFCPDPFCI